MRRTGEKITERGAIRQVWATVVPLIGAFGGGRCLIGGQKRSELGARLGEDDLFHAARAVWRVGVVQLVGGERGGALPVVGVGERVFLDVPADAWADVIVAKVPEARLVAVA